MKSYLIDAVAIVWALAFALMMFLAGGGAEFLGELHLKVLQ